MNKNPLAKKKKTTNAESLTKIRRRSGQEEAPISKPKKHRQSDNEYVRKGRQPAPHKPPVKKQDATVSAVKRGRAPYTDKQREEMSQKLHAYWESEAGKERREKMRKELIETPRTEVPKERKQKVKTRYEIEYIKERKRYNRRRAYLRSKGWDVEPLVDFPPTRDIGREVTPEMVELLRDEYDEMKLKAIPPDMDDEGIDLKKIIGSEEYAEAIIAVYEAELKNMTNFWAEKYSPKLEYARKNWDFIYHTYQQIKEQLDTVQLGQWVEKIQSTIPLRVEIAYSDVESSQYVEAMLELCDQLDVSIGVEPIENADALERDAFIDVGDEDIPF